MAIKVNIIWNGEKITFSELEKNQIFLKSIVFSDKRNNQADDIQFQLIDLNRKFQDALIPQKQDLVQFEIFQDGEKLVTPSFYIDGVDWDGNNNVNIRGLNVNYVKKSSFWKRKNASWKNTSLRKIVDGISQQNNYQLIWFGNDFEIPYIQQKGISDFRFLKTIAKRRGDFFKLIGKKLIWGSTTEEVTYTRTNNTTTVNTGSGSRFIEIKPTDFKKFGLSSTTAQKTKIQLEELNVFNKRLDKILGDFSDDFDLGFENGNQQDIKAEESVKGSLADTVLGSLTCNGDVAVGEWNSFKPGEILSGSVVYLSGQGKLSGTYIIDVATHNITSGGWTINCNMSRIVSTQLKKPTTRQKYNNKVFSNDNILVKGKDGKIKLAPKIPTTSG